MTITLTAPVEQAAAAPECHGQQMTPQESFITRRVFHRCDVCLRNDYSITATTHAHTH